LKTPFTKRAGGVAQVQTREPEKKKVTPIILATYEAETGRISILGQPGQKVHKTPSQLMKKKLGMVTHACHPSCVGSVKRIVVQVGPGMRERPYSKNNQRDWRSGSSGSAPA
jgi:hypothetical protein